MKMTSEEKNLKRQAERMLQVIEDGYCPNIICPKMKGKTDSFFYEGDIASVKKLNGTELLLVAAGDIRILHIKKGNVVGTHNGVKSYDDFPLNIETDKDLKKIDDKHYRYDMNNWFEILWKKADIFESEIGGSVVGTYDEAMQLLKDYYDNEEY